MNLKGTVEEWRVVFFVTAAFYVIGGIPYAFCAQGDVEEWALLENVEANNKSEIIKKEILSNQQTE